MLPQLQSPPDHLGRVLAERDLRFAEPLLPTLSAALGTYFRSEVRGLDNVPQDEPVLFVGNHSGGVISPDSMVFILALLDQLGVNYPLFWLGHGSLVQLPLVGAFLRRCGVLNAAPEAAVAALESGASVAVYPGGWRELHRPWSARHEIRFFGRTGFLRVAEKTGARIVPVVSAGGHNTYFPLTDGRRLAQALRLDRVLKIKAVPISIALPWILNVGDALGHLPWPARIVVEVLPPISVAEECGSDLSSAYQRITGLMQATLDRLATERANVYRRFLSRRHGLAAI